MHSASVAGVTRKARRASDSSTAHFLARAGLMRRVVELFGITGTIARGLVFALAGALVIDAAIIHQASESGGIDKALLTLRNQPFGEFLMRLAALGLVVFGAYAGIRASPPSSTSRRGRSSGSGWTRRSATSSTAARA